MYIFLNYQELIAKGDKKVSFKSPAIINRLGDTNIFTTI
jgi:hypothetical protein